MLKAAARSLIPRDGAIGSTAIRKIAPLMDIQERWEEFVISNPCATLYHQTAWVRALLRAYGFEILAVTLEREQQITAGCLLARSKIPFVSRLVGLPFSDSCAPLATNCDDLLELLTSLTEAQEIHGRIELRGIEAPSPWLTTDDFNDWTLDLARPFPDVQRSVNRNFRRQVRHAVDQGMRIESGDSEELLHRFYRLQLQTRRRLGVPPQPLRFFKRVREEFTRDSNFEVWVASRNGVDHAGVVVLRDKSRLHAKWSARAAQSADGASHLVFFSILEQYAGKVDTLDLGRADARNTGLVRFKKELGAVSSRLPYSYFPVLRPALNSEAPERSTTWITQLWRHLPIALTRAIGAATYRFLG